MKLKCVRLTSPTKLYKQLGWLFTFERMVNERSTKVKLSQKLDIEVIPKLSCWFELTDNPCKYGKPEVCMMAHVVHRNSSDNRFFRNYMNLAKCHDL